jgi:DNA primase
VSATKGRIPAELLQKIKDAVNLIEVVGEHVVLRKGGSNHMGLCPFHNERSPSFSVSEPKQFFHCFGCKKSGDIVTFVQEIHGLSFLEAIEELAERARIPLPKDWEGGGGDPETEKRRAAAREKLAVALTVTLFASVFYRQSLTRLPHALQYFRARGADAELIRAFYAGAAHPSWDALARHLVGAKAPMQVAVDLGLIRPSQKGRTDGPGYFDLFRHRAMFPIFDLRGRVAGFGGRTLPPLENGPDVGNGDSPKYLNSPESITFQKSKVAFGLFQAAKHVREADEVVIVEGYFDVLALHAAGFRNAVSTSGTALTPDHIHMFRRLGKKITILFDGDKAGITATDRAMELGLEHGEIFHGAVMPEGLDPDELLFDQETGQALPEGRERMQAILAGAQPLLDARIAAAAEYARQGPEARTQGIKQVAAWLARYRDPVGREVRMQAAQNALGITRPLLEKAMAGGGQGRGGGRERAAPAPPAQVAPRRPAAPRNPLSTREKVLLGALARGGEFTRLLADGRSKLPPKLAFSDLFDYGPAREFVAVLFADPAVFDRFRKAPETFLQGELDPQLRSTLTEAMIAPESPFDLDEVRTALGRSTARVWARFSQQIKEALAAAEAKKDAELQSQLMKEYLDVQRRMKEFTSFL